MVRPKAKRSQSSQPKLSLRKWPSHNSQVLPVSLKHQKMRNRRRRRRPRRRHPIILASRSLTWRSILCLKRVKLKHSFIFLASWWAVRQKSSLSLRRETRNTANFVNLRLHQTPSLSTERKQWIWLRRLVKLISRALPRNLKATKPQTGTLMMLVTWNVSQRLSVRRWSTSKW